ncbi:SLATT domain-containing protein [Micromonospora chersina]|uniref:SLATT domain-containing protein n=1 Tax=Micromonospora chersina TaxID=47854 RepID=UPI003715C596
MDAYEHLSTLLSTAIAEHRKRKGVLRRAAWALHISVMLVGATSTVLLGLQLRSPAYLEWSRNIALVLGALSTFIGGLLAFWNLDIYWLKRKVILNQLVMLNAELQFLRVAGDPLSVEDLRPIFARYITLMGHHNEYWQEMLNRDGTAGSAGSVAVVARQRDAA